MDLSTTYLGLSLKNPLVPSASPLSKTLDGIRRMEDAGAAAVVMYSLFEEQITHDSQQLDNVLDYGTDSFGEALSFFPDLGNYNIGPESYLELVRSASEAMDIPIIGSLNGASIGGWTDYARRIEQAGAAALELNEYFIPTDPEMSGAEVEERYLAVLREIKAHVSIPVSVKLNPYFSAMSHMARRLAGEGAAGLVLFNRFYQPDFDLDELEVVPSLQLSNSHEMRLPMHWAAILFGRVPVDLAITSGVHTHIDVLKGLMAGANVTMMASELMANGLGRLGEIRTALLEWMEEHEYESVTQMRGSMSQIHVADPSAFERANYMKELQSWRPDPTGVMA
jgi:dihydroorotate dehydrogenase (fumarate)